MTRLFGWGGALVALWLGMVWQAAAADPPAPELTKAKKIVEGDERLKDDVAIIQVLDEPAVRKSLPEHVYVAVVVRQFPVAKTVPEGLAAANVFVVDRDGKVTVLKDAKELEKFFKANLRATKGDDEIKDAARAWARLVSVLHSDGVFKFRVVEDAKVAGEAGARTATMTLGILTGGSGTLTGKVTVDADGKVTQATQEAKIFRGPRPRLPK
jgi:hypothetical protein